MPNERTKTIKPNDTRVAATLGFKKYRLIKPIL